MLYALLIFLFYCVLGAVGVLIFWALQIRFGDARDIDPNFFLSRWLARKQSAAKLRTVVPLRLSESEIAFLLAAHQRGDFRIVADYAIRSLLQQTSQKEAAVLRKGNSPKPETPDLEFFTFLERTLRPTLTGEKVEKSLPAEIEEVAAPTSTLVH